MHRLLSNLIDYSKKSTAELPLIALASTLIYLLVFTLPFLLPRYYNLIPPVDYTKLTNYSAAGLLAYVSAVIGLFWLYWQAMRRLSPTSQIPDTDTKHGLRLIAGGGGLFAAILLFAYPLTAIDLFVYAIRSRGWALYNLPPLATPPQVLPANDPWLGLAGEWIDAASPYGPLWELLALAAFYAGQAVSGSYLAHLLALKLVALPAYLGCVGLVWKLLGQTRPHWQAAGTLAFAWSPLVLLESIQNGHNDIVMSFCLLAALWLLHRADTLPHRLLVCVALAASILVKFVTLLVVPFFLLALTTDVNNRRRRLAEMALYGLFLIALVVAGMWPVWPGWAQWAVPNAGSQAGRSLLATLVLGLRGWLGINSAFDVARLLLVTLLGLIYLRQVWLSLTAPPPDRLTQAVRPSFYVLFWYVLLGAPVFHAWYLLWFAPLAVLLLPRPRPLQATLVFSLTALLIIPYFETVRVWYPLLLQNQLLGHLIGVPLLLLPPAITLLWPISKSRRSEV